MENYPLLEHLDLLHFHLEPFALTQKRDNEAAAAFEPFIPINTHKFRINSVGSLMIG